MKTHAVILTALAMIAIAAAAQETELTYFAGIVLGVDSTNRLVSVEEASFDAKHLTFSVPADSQLRKRGNAIELNMLRNGEPVSIEYEKTPSGLVARTIKVITKPDDPSTEP